MQVWFQDFGVSRVGFAVSSECASQSAAPTDTSTRCVVDVGWSGINIVPTHDGKSISPDCIRRVPVGGRHLVNIYKYYTSYRQWNLMDQEFLLRDVLQQLGYLSMQFEDELKTARRLPLGRRPYDRDYILPDYQTTHRGQVAVPAALQRQREMEQATAETPVPEAVEENAEESSGEDDTEGPTEAREKRIAKEENEVESEEEETEEEMRRRILKQRQEEERRKRQQELEQQILQVSVERFSVPETLFRPSDAGLSPDIAGLPQAVCSSIAACPPIYRAALYQSVFLTGGLSQLPNFQARLDRDLRCLAPSQYEVRVQTAESPIDAAWLGAKEWAQNTSCTEWSVSFGEWESSRKKTSKEWHRLLHQNGGQLV
jgi:actin-related protein